VRIICFSISAFRRSCACHASLRSRDVPLYTDERGHPDNVGDKLEDLHPVVRINPVTG